MSLFIQVTNHSGQLIYIDQDPLPAPSLSPEQPDALHSVFTHVLNTQGLHIPFPNQTPGSHDLIGCGDHFHPNLCFRKSLSDPQGKTSSTNNTLLDGSGEKTHFSNLFLISSVLLELSKNIKFAMSFAGLK